MKEPVLASGWEPLTPCPLFNLCDPLLPLPLPPPPPLHSLSRKRIESVLKNTYYTLMVSLFDLAPLPPLPCQPEPEFVNV
jgi:hypothetical protein